ncbi:hypothetical protein QQP08_021358 [Theobroma cacao]|nr:hypothetical protein QQP08_021358 [Theobroma cacao]
MTSAKYIQSTFQWPLKVWVKSTCSHL